MKIKDLRANSLDPDENSLSADSSASTLFANSAIFVFGALRFNLSIHNLFALLQIFSLNIMRNANANKKDPKQPAYYWPVLTLWLSWPYTVNVSCY